MKRYLILLAVLALMLPMFAGVFTIGTGTSTQYYIPAYGLYDYSWSKVIYTAAEINNAGLTAGQIDAIGFNVSDSPNNYTRDPMKVYIRHTTGESVDTSYPGTTGFQLMYDASYTWNGSGWHYFIFDSPFMWDGTSNIEMLFENHDGNWLSGYPSFYSTSTSPTYLAAYKYADGALPTTAGTLTYARPNIQIITPMVDPPNPTTLVAPADGAAMVSTSINLAWNGMLGADDYHVYLGTSNPPNFVETVVATTYNPGELQSGTTYYWQIVPHNQYGDATNCPVWSFTTVPAGMVTIGTGNSNQMLPVHPYYGYNYSQSIYLQSEINMQDQRIEKIAFYWNGAGAGTNTSDWVVYMGHTDRNTFASTSDWLPLSELTQVYAGNLGITATAGWKEIVLTNPFVYNNIQNLVIAVDENTPGYDGSSQFFFSTLTSGQNRSLRFYNDNTNPDPASPPTGSLVAAHPNIMMQFGDLPEDPIFSYAPTSINFGMVMNASPSLPQNVMVSNTGAGVINLAAGDISIIGPNANEFSFSTANLPAALGPGQNVAIPVIVTATTEGLISATLRIVYNAQNYDVALSANGLPAGLVMIGDGTTTGIYLPVNTLWGYSYSQTVYLQSEINVQDQRIEKIAYRWSGTGSQVNNNSWTIYMGHTDATGFAATTEWIPYSQLTEVYSGTVNFPTGADWMEIILDTPFVYSNTQNLVIAVLENSPSYTSGGTFINTVAPGRSIRAYSDSVVPDVTNPPGGASQTLQGHYPNIMMIFGDLPEDPIFSYNPTSLDFGQVLHGVPSAPLNVIVSNTGAGVIDLTAADISIFGANANEFSFSTANLPAALNPGQNVAIPVSVTAVTEGAISATLRIVWGGNNYDVALGANGLPAGIVIIGNGTATQRQPFNHYYGYERSAAIYTPAQYGNPGVITQAGWYCGQASSAAVPYKIYAGTTTNAAFTAGSWANLIAGLTLVKEGSYTFSETGWVLFELDTPFAFGGDNLIFAIESNYGGGGTSPYPMFRYTNATAGSHQYWNQDSNPPTGNGTLNSQLPNLMMNISLPSGPPAAPILVSPANGATGMPLEGFNLTWNPDLNNGGFPNYYAIFMAHDEDDIFGEEYFETTVSHFDPVAEGGLSFQNSERWFWAVSAVNDEGEAVSETYRFDVIAAPAQIAVNPSFFDIDLEVGETSVQPLYITNDGGLPLEYSIRFEDQTDDIRAAYSPVIHQIQPHQSAADFAERAPFTGDSVSSSRAYLDLQFIYANADGNGEYGVSSDGNFIYTSKWSAVADQRIFKYSLDGEYLGYFEIPGFSGVRDFTYDGTYFYGATNSTTVYVMDFTNESLVRTITVPVAARGIAYDADRNGLWITNGWNGPLRLVDMNGALLQTLNTSAASMAGLAYDALSGNGSIWANVQAGSTTNTLVEIDAETGEVLYSMEITADFIPGLDADSSAGGIDVVMGIVPGYATILANAQNVLMYGLELCSVATWAQAEPRTGVVAPGTTETVNIHFDTEGMPGGTYEGMFTINHSAPVDPVEVPVTLTITGDWLPVFNIDETAWDFGTAELMNPIQKEFTIRNSGGPYLALTASSFSITGDTESNFSLELLNLPVELGYNETYRLKAVFAPQSLGNKTATLNIEDGLGRTLHQIPLSGNCVNEPIGEILNLEASVENIFNVRLNWGITSGVAGEPGWLHYDNGENYSNIGTGAVGTFDVAIKFSSADLYGYTQYGDMQFEKVRFFPTSGNTDYTLKIWTGNDYSIAPTTLVYTQQIAAVTPNEWNEVILDTAFPIAANQAIWIGYNCNVYDGASLHPAGSDAGPAVVGKGDVIYLGNWYSMKNQYGLDYNWNLQAYVNDAIAITGAGHWLNIPVANRDSGLQDISHLSLSTSGNYAPQTRVLRGFNVYRNGVQVNSALVPSPTYLDTGLDTGTYTYTVQGVYYSQNTDISDPAQVEIIIPPATPLPYAQDFEAHADNTLPEGWMRSSNGLGWEIGTALSSEYLTIPAHTVYAAANDDAGGSGNDGSVDYLNMPALDFQIEGDGATVLLSFDSFFTGQYSHLAFVEVSTNNIDWEVVYTVPSNAAWIARSVDLSEYLGNANVFIRFHSYDSGTWASGWAIDNVAVDVTFEDTFPPVITHLPLINTPITNAPYEVIAHVVDDANWNNDITLVQLAYFIDDGALVTVNMQLQGVETYVGYIPAQPLNTEISYYITAKDSENNEATTEELYFEVQNPVYMYYDLGGSAYVTFGQVYGPAVLFDNPFYGSGTPMQLLAVDGDLYYEDEVTLVIYEVTDDGFAPVYIADVEFDGIDMGIFDLSEEDVIIEGEQFLVAYQGVPADNYFLIDRNAYYYGRSYVIISGQLYMVSESDGAWVIGALVTNVTPEELDAPVVTVALNDDGNPVLSWNEVPGATMYEIQISEDPYGTDWIAWDIAYVPTFVYNGDEDMMFFRVVAMDGPSITKRAIAQSEPINLRGEVFPGMRAMKANVTPRLRK